MVTSKSKRVSKKNVNINNNNDNITIDAKHNEMIEVFMNEKKSIPELKLRLKNLIQEYKDSKNNALKTNSEYIIERNLKRDEIHHLQDKIKNINNSNKLNNYYLEVGSLLHNYYENIENCKNNEESDESNEQENFENNLISFENNENDIVSKNKNDSKSQYSVIDFFNNREKEISENNESNENEGNYTSMKISDFVKEESKFKKKNFLDDYLKKIDSNYVSKIKIDHQINTCKDCNQQMTIYPSDGIQICTNCGVQEFILIESDKPSFKDPPLEVCYFSYKRINHFNEWLAQFQAKESTEIPDEVYEKIIAEIKKERIKDLSKLDTKKIRQYLKKIKLNKFYDHAAHILYQINGISPPSMSKELEEKLRLMFKEIQAPFMEVCPKTRKNFLNYSYVLHKFVELLSLDEYKVYFPLLKDREKLHQTDMIWKKICDKIGWQFFKSI